MVNIVKTLVLMIMTGSCYNQTKELQVLDLAFFLQTSRHCEVVKCLYWLKSIKYLTKVCSVSLVVVGNVFVASLDRLDEVVEDLVNDSQFLKDVLLSQYVRYYSN